MADAFLFAFQVISPMVLLMLLGFWGRRKEFFNDLILGKLNSFIFKTGIPALMFCNIYTLNELSDISLPLMFFTLLSLAGLTLVGIGLAYVFADRTEQKGVIIQATFRSNFAIVGASLALALGGSEGSVVATSLQAPSILYFNIVAVVCLTFYSDHHSIDARELARSILTNPLILAQLAGVLCLALRVIIPVDREGVLLFSLSGTLPWLYSFLCNLSEMTSPLVLILLGAQIDFTAINHLKKQLIVGVLMRLIGAPALGFLMAIAAAKLNLFLLTPATIGALLALYGSPCPAASAIMAEQMEGDGELARQYVGWSTVFSMLTLFLWALIFRTISWL